MEKLLHCKQMLSHLNDQHLFLFAYCVINSYLLCRSASQVKEMIILHGCEWPFENPTTNIFFVWNKYSSPFLGEIFMKKRVMDRNAHAWATMLYVYNSLTIFRMSLSHTKKKYTEDMGVSLSLLLMFIDVYVLLSFASISFFALFFAFVLLIRDFTFLL